MTIAAKSPPAEYVLGDAPPQRHDFARFETKPPSPGDTGAGYERWRSWEYRPETSRQGKEDVYVYVHRLLAIVECYPGDMPIDEVLRDLDGKDVHHQSGVKWDNRPEILEVIDHGHHSSLTQSQMRAFGEDAKQQAKSDAPADPDRCERCGDTDGPFGTSDGFDGVRCLDCATAECDGEPIDMGV